MGGPTVEVLSLVRSFGADLRLGPNGQIPVKSLRELPECVVRELRECKDLVPGHLSDERIYPPTALGLLKRLRKGHEWLADVNMVLLEEREAYEGLEDKFINALDVWDGLDAIGKGTLSLRPLRHGTRSNVSR